MFNSKKLIKKYKEFKNQQNIIIGGADLSCLPSKEELINQNLLEATKIAQSQKQQIITEAQNQAEQIIKTAQEEAEKLKANSYEKGFQIGKEEALTAINSELSSLLTSSSKILEKIEEERQECLHEEENRIYKVIVLIAKHILKRDLSINENLAIDFIKEGIKKLESKAEVKIIVDATSSQHLNKMKDELAETCPSINNLTILTNPNFNIGEVILESESQRLDLRLDAQLEELAKEILK